MSFSILGHQLQVSSVPVIVDIPARLNIKKRKERIIYRTLSKQDNINLAYVIGRDIDPRNNLFISDRSTSLTQNRIPSTQDIIIRTAKTLVLNVDKFLITNRFTEETPTRPETPLFYKHTLAAYNDTLDDFEERTLLGIEFMDHNLYTLQLTEYVLDTTTGYLFNNIQNSYSSTNGSFSVIYIKYIVRVGTGLNQHVEIYHELINNEPIYQQASFEDLDEFGNIQTGHEVFLLEQQSGGQLFLITLPEYDRYAYQEIPDSRLKVLYPTAIDLTTSWNLRITNGQFITSLKTNTDLYLNHKYHIAEFDAQTFNPYPPYKLQMNQSAVWINSNLIYLPKNIQTDVQIGFYLDILIYDNLNNIKFAYSNDPSKIGTLFESAGDIYYSNGILSIDAQNGFIELLDKVQDTDKILATYITAENEYELTTIDFNPINNFDILNKRFVLYIVPETTSTGELFKSLYYLIVNTLGEITYSSQVAENYGTALDLPTQKMILEDFDENGLPKHLFYYDKTSTTSGLNSRYPNGAYTELSFIDKYTVESQLITNSLMPSGTDLLNFIDNPRYLILADIYVGESQAPDSLTTFDIRTQGGGIKPEYEFETPILQPEAFWYWDFNSQYVYPGAGVFLAEIPQNILSEHGGTFSYDEIVDIVERHMKIGGYAIINTYGLDPVITEVIPGSGIVSLSWPTYGSGILYNVYCGVSLDEELEKENILTLQDNTIENNFIISGLRVLTKYYCQIEAIDDSESSFSDIIETTTTAF